MIKNNIIYLLVIFLFYSCSSDDEYIAPDFIKTGEYTGEYYPTTTWRECAPEEVGMISKKLQAVYDYCNKENHISYSFIIIKDGYIVAESYFRDSTAKSKIHSYSLAKSFTAALSGIAIQEGLIQGVDDKIYNYIPELQSEDTDPLKKEISIKNLLTMAAGYEWNEDELSFTNNDLYKMRSYPNYVDYVLNKPMVETPGKVWNYSSGNPLLLGRIIENVSGTTAFDYAKKTLFADLGISDVTWRSDDSGHTIAAWSLKLNSRDYAKLGYLYWKNGVWDDKQILPEYWVEDTRKPALESVPQYGYLFWRAYRYADHVGTQVPEDTYMATGLFQKYVIIIPSYDLVLVRLGEDVFEGDGAWDTAKFIELVIDAVDTP